jgi:hypothetical protein
MLPTARIVIAISVLVLLAAASALPAAARGVQSEMRIRTAGGVTITPDEQAAVARRVADTLDFHRQFDAWRCVTPLDGRQGAPGPLATGVLIDVLIEPNPDRSGNILVIVEVIGLGKRAGGASGGGSQTIPHEQWEESPHLREGHIIRAVSQGLDSVMYRLHPCTPDLKAKGKVKITREINFEGTWEGQIRLALAEDGSFSGTMPVSFTWSPIVIPGAGVCTVTGGDPPLPTELQGQHDEDGSLKFDRLAAHNVSGTLTSSCTVAGQTATASIPVPPMAPIDAAARNDIRLALEHGAQKAILVTPEPGTTVEWTLELSYDDATGPNVAQRSPVSVDESK